MMIVLSATGAMAQAPSAAADHVQRYIIELRDAPLAAFDGREIPSADLVPTDERLEATNPLITGERRLNVRSPRSRAYLRYLDRTHDALRLDAALRLGRSIQPRQVYRNALNGMAVDLTSAEARKLADSPYVKSISKDTRHRLHTDSGPTWIGAGQVWGGQSGYPPVRGEGVVVGIIDSGINWDHPSFKDPGGDGYNHVNPFGSQLGLCSKPEVHCNDKLAGVYDFVEDDPDTGDVVEENTDGKDNSSVGHGSHVAGIAVGNTLNLNLNGTVNTTVSGVAPHANLVVYRVCYVGEPEGDDTAGCMGSAILKAIDQAITDGVDVINYSIGTDAFSPWSPGQIPEAFLNARNAGIFVATSAGNEGPNAGTVGSPANAPWVFAVGNATHNRIFGSLVQDLSGGASPSPGTLVGASLTQGIGVRKIVHAKNFGNALCGAGAAELGATCAANQGLSNPWKNSKPFNGEIVVCNRGTYGRIEKGKNLMLAGAGGYILANTDNEGESVVADEHCLPTTHIGDIDGDKLRGWLDSGSNHMGSLSGFTLVRDDKYADQVNSSSSRGPVGPPVQNTLKPNVIAPGTSVLSSYNVGEEFIPLTGTSMSSPHAAGAAALVRGVHPGWNVAQVMSALEMTATPELARNTDGSIATPHDRGAGRLRIGEAVNAGLYLNVTGAQFAGANPNSGGNPKNLNLAGLVDADCQGSCSFSRTVTDMQGGGSWTAQATGFPAGVQVSVTPSSFSLGNAANRAINISINVQPSGIVGEWVYGKIVFSAAGSSDLALTAAVYSSGGTLPSEWVITDNRDSGYTEFNLSGLAKMPDATFINGGLVAPTRTSKKLVQDPTVDLSVPEKSMRNFVQNHDPFDGGQGVFTVWHNLPQGGLWLHAETLATTAKDIDLYVGRDDNLDGSADAEEQLCKSTSPEALELCDLFNLPAGNYWIVVQNWEGGSDGGDDVTLLSAGIPASDDGTLVVTGPGIVGSAQQFTVRASWSDVNALAGEEWLGAVGIGTRRDQPTNIGVIPVRFNRTGYAMAQTLPMMNGKARRFALAGNAAHDRLFVDIPPDVTSLNVMAQGATGSQNNALMLQLYRQDFNLALGSPPFAKLPDGLSPVASASGSGGVGPEIKLNNSVAPGRYFIKLSNVGGSPIAASIVASINSNVSSFSPHRGSWDFDRVIYQGADWQKSGSNNFSVWFTYDNAGQPTMYIAAGPIVAGNIWTSDLLRVTNDGSQQQEKVVGRLSVTFTSSNQMIYSYTVLGESGFDTMHPNAPNTCPLIGGVPRSYTGHWYRGQPGLGGANVIVYKDSQAQVHYLYDDKGDPRWVIAADDNNQSATAQVIPLLQFDGFCAVCTPKAVTWKNVGTVTRTFTSEKTGNWTLDFDLLAPLSQSIDRTDSVVKLSDTLVCE